MPEPLGPMSTAALGKSVSSTSASDRKPWILMDSILLAGSIILPRACHQPRQVAGKLFHRGGGFAADYGLAQGA